MARQHGSLSIFPANGGEVFLNPLGRIMTEVEPMNASGETLALVAGLGIISKRVFETRLEQSELRDSNRILDMNFSQHIATYPFIKSFSVDSPEDIVIVEETLRQDSRLGSYKC